jgi:hypothetical protein
VATDPRTSRSSPVYTEGDYTLIQIHVAFFQLRAAVSVVYFTDQERAERRACELARQDQVSLWRSTEGTPGTRTLIVSYRPEPSS